MNDYQNLRSLAKETFSMLCLLFNSFAISYLNPQLLMMFKMYLFYT